MAYSPEEVERLAREWVDAVNSGTGPSGGWRLQLLRRRTRRDFSGYAPESAEARGRQRNIDGKKVLVDANGDPVAYEPVDPPEGGRLCDELPVRIRRFVPGCPWALADAVIRRLHRIAPYTGIMWNGVRVEGTYRPTRTELVRDEQSQSPGERGSLGTYTIVQDLLEVTACEDVLDVVSGVSCAAEEAVTYRWDADTVEGVPPDGYTGCEQGVTWAVRAVQRNEEGSFDYQVVKTVAKTTSWGPVVVECNAQYRTTERGWRNLYGEGTDASPWEARPCGGKASPVDVPPECDSCAVRTSLQVQRNQDCTYDVVVRTREVVKPVVAGWTQGTACRAEAVASVRNSCEEPVVPVPAPGERVTARIDRNEDDTWSSEIRVLSAEDELEYGWTDGPACRPRTVSVRENLRARPKVPAVNPGETMDASLTRTEDCLWNLRTAVTAAREPVSYDFTEGSQCRPVDVSIRQAQPSQPSPSELAPGPGETVSAAVSRNEDCTWDWRREVSHAQEAEDIAWSEGSQCRPVESHSLVSQPSYAGLVPAPGRGERVSASVSRNADCTYDVQYRVARPAAGGPDAWSDGTCAQTTGHTLYSDVAEIVDPGAGGVGETVSASWTRNEDCTYTGRVSRTASQEAEYGWDDGTKCGLKSSTRVYRNRRTGDPRALVPAPDDGETVRASARRNDDCTYDVTVETTTAEEMDTGLVEWTSKDASASSTAWYRHGIRVFRNLRNPPRPEGDHNWTAYELRQNDDCTWSGHMAYRDLDSWEAGGQGSGGIRENDLNTFRVPVRFKSASGLPAVVGYDEYRMPVITFIGRGNEGTEAYWRTHGATWLPPNAKLGDRTYAKYVEVKYFGTDEWKLLSGAEENVQVQPGSTP